MSMSSTAPQPQRPNRGNRLRALIDDLILFGRLLIEALQSQPTSDITTRIINRFNGRGIAAIIARITRRSAGSCGVTEWTVQRLSHITTSPCRHSCA